MNAAGILFIIAAVFHFIAIILPVVGFVILSRPRAWPASSWRTEAGRGGRARSSESPTSKKPEVEGIVRGCASTAAPVLADVARRSPHVHTLAIRFPFLKRPRK